jgi:hypothetical protein
LQPAELQELLAVVKTRVAHPWAHPLFCFAAHTGARRSETLRVQVTDIDFGAGTVLVREKKRTRGQRTTRRVPLTAQLAAVLKDYLAGHPGGELLFCQGGEVARSKKRSRTTGHLDEKVRPSGLKARLSTVRARGAVTAAAVTRDECHDHFKRTLAGTKWEVIRGLHTLRHSFIWACASKGVDQRSSTSGRGTALWSSASATGTCSRRCSVRRSKASSVSVRAPALRATGRARLAKAVPVLPVFKRAGAAAGLPAGTAATPRGRWPSTCAGPARSPSWPHGCGPCGSAGRP